MEDAASILGIDVGSVCVGVARALITTRLAAPLTTLPRDDATIAALRELCMHEHATRVVIGLPRGLDGQATAQTTRVQEFGKQLTEEVHLPISWQDEALTSVKAEEELRVRGKPYRKADIDALAATYILEDYLHGNL